MKPNTSKMEYRYLGNSGLRISVLGMGNWVNNDDDKLTVDSVKICLEHGVNFFDTAEVYGLGRAETSLGKAFKELGVPREKIVVTTKVYKIGDDPNDSFQSRKHIIEGVNNSLKRLQMDYVDIVYAHRYDLHTPLEETCRAYNYLIDNGKAFYWGTSEWTASQIMEAYKICDKLNLIPPIVEQSHYNMFERKKIDNEYRDLFLRYKMGTTTFSPLFGGVLTGKYITEKPKDSRFVVKAGEGAGHEMIYQAHKKEWDEKLLKLKDIAEKKIGCSLTQLAISWIIANPDISCCILAGSKASQFEETLKAVEFYKKLDKEILKEIEEIEEFCKAMPRYKRPHKIIFADVPRNPTGKIEKPKLRKIYCGESLVASQIKG